jgi:hypothetical protein
MKDQTIRRSLRGAIYTRVSTEQGLEQDINSLDAQREACEAYVKSQAHEGWRLLRDRYDDGGFSGGSMDRDLGRGLRLERLACEQCIGRLARSLSPHASTKREIIQGANDAKTYARPMPANARAILIDALRDAHRWLNELLSDPRLALESLASREGKTVRFALVNRPAKAYGSIG